MRQYKAQLRLRDAAITQSIRIQANDLTNANIIARRAKRDFGDNVDIRSMRPERYSSFFATNAPAEGYVILGGENAMDSTLVEVNMREEKLFSLGIK